jgi:hypothetical protein
MADQSTNASRILGCLVSTVVIGVFLFAAAVFVGPGFDLPVTMDPCAGGTQRAKAKRTGADIAIVAGALECFRKDRGGYPAGDWGALQGALVPRYLQEIPRTDAWKRPYILTSLGPVQQNGLSAGYLIGSLGCDGRFGSERYSGVAATYAADLLLVNGSWQTVAQPFARPIPLCQQP